MDSFLLNFQVNGEFGSDMVCCDWCYLLNVDRQLPLVTGANGAKEELIAWQHIPPHTFNNLEIGPTFKK